MNSASCSLRERFAPLQAKTLKNALAHRIRREFPQVHVGGGLSNVSHGLPQRKLINLAMVAAAVYCGMDVALVDPCTPQMVPLILASEVVGGTDSWCANYIAAYRSGKLG